MRYSRPPPPAHLQPTELQESTCPECDCRRCQGQLGKETRESIRIFLLPTQLAAPCTRPNSATTCSTQASTSADAVASTCERSSASSAGQQRLPLGRARAPLQLRAPVCRLWPRGEDVLSAPTGSTFSARGRKWLAEASRFAGERQHPQKYQHSQNALLGLCTEKAHKVLDKHGRVHLDLMPAAQRNTAAVLEQLLRKRPASSARVDSVDGYGCVRSY